MRSSTQSLAWGGAALLLQGHLPLSPRENIAPSHSKDSEDQKR